MRPDRPDEREAELLDASIDRALAGRAAVSGDPVTDEVVAGLLRAYAEPVPQALPERVARAGRMRPGALVRGLAAALGILMVLAGAPPAFAGVELARFLGLPYEPHVYTELGLAYLAVGAGLLFGAWRPSWLRGAVAVGAPLAIAVGVFGLLEIPHAPNPAAELFHVLQAIVGALLVGAWWTSRRRA